VKSAITLASSILSVLLSASIARAGTNAPIPIGPRTIPTNPAPVYFWNSFFTPPAFGAASVSQSPLAATKFPKLATCTAR